MIKMSSISKFWKCSSIRYSAPFAILLISILPFNINFFFYGSDSRKFYHSTFARWLIFKSKTSSILKLYCSKFWPHPDLNFQIFKLKSCHIDVSIKTSLNIFTPCRTQNIVSSSNTSLKHCLTSTSQISIKNNLQISNQKPSTSKNVLSKISSFRNFFLPFFFQCKIHSFIQTPDGVE